VTGLGLGLDYRTRWNQVPRQHRRRSYNLIDASTSDPSKPQEGFAQNQGSRRLTNIRISRLVRSILLVVTLVGILAVGLWPLRAPQNGVEWVPGENAISFTGQGIAIGTSAFSFIQDGSRSSTLDLWVQPARIWIRGTILAFYNPRTNREFAVCQDRADLVLRLSNHERNVVRGTRELRLRDVFRRKQIFLSIASDGQRITIYLDGLRALTSTEFKLANEDVSGQVMVGGSAFRDDSWPGKVKGIAIYGAELSAEQIAQNYDDWTQRGEPVSDSSERLLALYLFRERTGTVIHSAASSGAALEIPKRFVVVEQLRFESPISEFHAQPNYRKNVLINILGFIPLGFTAALVFAPPWNAKRATIAAALVGTATSLTIEYFQSYLPTRYSGLTDIGTNTVGAWVGAVLYCAAIKLAAGKFRIEPKSPHRDI
jgi:VanZ family protein